MNELKKIVHAYQATDFSQRKAALATVISVTGSSYRSPGARMYITDDGRWYGSISGGCLEGDALRKAREVMQTGVPRMVTYDTMDDENPTLGVSLGCNGIIHVLLEPIEEQNDPMAFMLKLYEQEDIDALATVYESENKQVQVANKWVFSNLTKKSQLTDIEKEIQQLLHQSIEHRRSGIQTVENTIGRYKVFLEVIEPPIHLMVFGGGYDAQPLVAMAKGLGWEVNVIDECAAHLIPVNFPEAQLTSCHRSKVSDHAAPKPYSAAVLISHNYYYDMEVMQQLLDTDIRYIGLLGPKKKGDKIKAELIEKGVEWNEDTTHRVHYPIGIDIGADTPEEIALSILAEIKAKFSGRSSGFLKYKTGPIHHKDPKSGEVFKQVYIHKSVRPAKNA
ncbi:XdhC family protein [Reichenbachiella ulvae]|uniref:XdhC family protein n=1 Tax=Reichenbachiella ulvae TaxID=2980104 RepID=A0ABT3CR11_9BACT|nr:XdhC family protein [Reichenbachiella ulvae]MCV9386011.1 XdhC family protein [Reichenbachiella ulvae]